MTTDIKVGATPGPWEISEHDPHSDRYFIFAEGYGVIALIASREDDREQVANARLTAASPRLLDALRGMVGLIQLIERDRPDLTANHRYIEALAAIEQAEGGQ